MQTSVLTEAAMQRRIAVFTIGMAFLAWMAIKLPMPALPFLGHYFHTSQQVFKVSVTLNLISFSVSQLFWGPLSDIKGRRAITLYAFSLAIIGTILAMLAVNIEMYLAGRILEGFAVGCAAPVGRAMMADRLGKVSMARVYAWYAIAALLPPAVGPVIGGYLFVFLGWRYIFAFFLILAVIYLLCCYFWLPETHQKKMGSLDIKKIIRIMVGIGSTGDFWKYVVTYALINGFMIAYYAAMPYWYVVQFHVREDRYAWFAFFPIASYIVASLITNRLLKRYSMDVLLLLGISVSLGIGVLICGLSAFILPNIFVTNLFMTLFSMASGIVTPMSNANLMHRFREHVTVLSAMMSGMRVGGAGLLVLISTNMSMRSYWELGVYTLILSCCAFGSFRVCHSWFSKVGK